MKNFIIAPTLAALALTATTVAHAQPSTHAAAADHEVPPERVPPGDVSTLNGELVEVGDQNKYRYSYKKMNVSSNPLGWIVGSYGVSVSYAVSANVAVRGDINLYDPIDSDVHGFELGVGAPIYFRKVYSGIFLEPGLVARTMSAGDNYNSNTLGPQVLLGWHWYWDSGLNVAIAAGVGRNWASEDSDQYHQDDEEIFGNGYMRFGYAF